MKQKLAIFLDTQGKSGGAYSELVYMIDKIVKLNEELEIVFISTSDKLDLNFIEKKYKIIFLKMNSFQRYISFLRNYGSFTRRIKKFFFKNKFEELLKKNKVDVVYFVNPSQFSLYIEDTDFIITVPDVSHRENVEFPEWAKNSNFIRLEEILNKSLKRAIAVITNASIIKEKIANFYKVENERIHLINHQPSSGISSFDLKSYKPSKKYPLPKNYIFYPAMFLPHKNHKCIIDAINILLRDYNINISAVFCGADKGYLKKIKNYVKAKELDKNIIFLDFVEYSDLPYLYINAFALTMPTFSGPTNIPPWEAFKLGVPVIYSDIFNVKQVYEDAVYYVDPYNSKTVAEAIKEVYQSESLRKKLVDNGTKLLKKVNFDKEVHQITEILNKNKTIKNSWTFKDVND